MTKNLEQIISASRLRVRQKSPFFATLSLFAHYKPSYRVKTTATDGKDIYFNPDYLLSLTKSQQDSLLLHGLLHAALLHPTRKGTREADLWNIAADIVVNGLIVEQNQFELPKNEVRKPEWEHMSVEEIYELLLKKSPDLKAPNPDLLSQPPEDCRDNSQGQDSNSSENNQDESDDTKSNSPENSQGNSQDDSDDKESNSPKNSQGNTLNQKFQELQSDDSSNDNSSSSNNQLDSLSEAKKEDLKAYWQNAMQQATLIQRTQSHGNLPSGIERQLQEISQYQVDWRSYLWRYLVQTPNDFQGYDRRFIGRKLYLDVIAGESVQVFVAVDTSGSIDHEDLQLFLSEVMGILGAYPHIKCDLYYADAAAYGPYPIDANTPMPKPQGGGGTSFIPFFDKVEENRDPNLEGVCIYLTDGYGTFPNKEPDLPTLWVITPGGLNIEQIPFGEAVKLIN